MPMKQVVTLADTLNLFLCDENSRFQQCGKCAILYRRGVYQWYRPQNTTFIEVLASGKVEMVNTLGTAEEKFVFEDLEACLQDYADRM